jgi:hypothetical protein
MKSKLSFLSVLLATAMSGQPLQSADFTAKLAIVEQSQIPFGDLPEKRNTHAASITEANNGTLLATWFGGSSENEPDVKIYVSQKPLGGDWSEPAMVDDGTCTRDGETKEYSTWNPVLFTDPKQGTLYLWYKITGIGPKPGYQNWWGVVRTSSDHGKTWSDRIWLPQVPNKLDIFKPYHFHATGPVKNHPIILPDGRLLCGSSTESPIGWRTHFEIYEAGDWTGQKHGVSVIGPLEGRGIQASFIVLSSDYKNLRAFTRDDGITSSHDGGKSWGPITKSPVTTSKGFHAVTTKEGWHFLVFNKDQTRTPLGLARSKDGENWEVIIEDLRSDGNMSMDYPAIMQSKDGNLHVVHTYGRKFINHIVLDTKYLSR